MTWHQMDAILMEKCTLQWIHTLQNTAHLKKVIHILPYYLLTKYSSYEL